tara:strand:- start:576 stop:761 length:186 start_codon:yes stop_codon:yes gene_type:complete
MKDSVKQVKINPRDLEEFDWGYDISPHKEKIRRRRRKDTSEEEIPEKRERNVRRKQKSERD